MQRFKRGVALAGTTLLLVLSLVFAGNQLSSVHAAPPGGWKEMGKNLKEDKAVRAEMLDVLRTGKLDTPEIEEKFKNHYEFRVAEMTWVRSQPSASKKRQEIKNELRRAGEATSQDVHQRLITMLADALPKVMKDNTYHPSARLNAMLLLGELNDRETAASDDRPTPLASALPLLLQEAADTAQEDFLRAAALVGVRRHVSLTMTAESRRTVMEAMKELVLAKVPPQGRSSDGHHWLRKQALDILASLAPDTPELNSPEMAATILGVLSDAKEPVSVRCKAAIAAGSLDGKSFQGTQVTDLVKPIGDAAVEFLAAYTSAGATSGTVTEDPSAETDADKDNSGSGADESKEGETKTEGEPTDKAKSESGDDGSNEDTPKKPAAKKSTGRGSPPDLAAQTLGYRLGCLVVAIKGTSSSRGLAVAAEGDSQKVMQDLQARLTSLATMAMSKNYAKRAERRETLRTETAEFRKWLRATAGGPAADAPTNDKQDDKKKDAATKNDVAG